MKNIIFDFGGVIADINRERAVKTFESIGLTDAEEWLDKYHQKGIFLEVEDGRIDAEGFCRKLGELCGKEITHEEAERGWLSFFINDPQYKLDYIAALRSRYNVYILSNTNPFVMGWARSKNFAAAGKPLDDYVDKLYLSYQMGQVKPNREIFEMMIEDSGLIPSESIFVDDGASNVAMGQELGFKTFQPLNGEDWREKLDKILAEG